MPHVIVKVYSGKSEEQNTALAEAVTQAVMGSLGSKDASISVAIEEIPPERWAEDVYKPDILERSETLYKKPGYNPFGW
jgi:4-oxalocrotonate tautomerase